jgi:D-sedoheptulose 7-phosphate isomerase
MSHLYGNFGGDPKVIRHAMRDSFLRYFKEIECALDKIDLNSFSQINEIIYKAFERGNKIFTMGNGGSGATASHLVCDLNKGVNSLEKQRFKAICLNDNLPTILAYANDVSYSDIFCQQLKNFMDEEDIVIGFSGSGNSKNVLQAVDYANRNGGVTIGFSGYDGGKLAERSMFSIVANINDMQKSEDIHLILCHLIMRTMCNLIKVRSYGWKNLFDSPRIDGIK